MNKQRVERRGLASWRARVPYSTDHSTLPWFVHFKPLNMVIDRRKGVLFTSAAALRLVLFFAFPSIPALLTGRVEISTPVTSFKRCKKTSCQSTAYR